MDASAVLVRAIEPVDLHSLRWVIYRAYFGVLLDLYGREAAVQYEVRSLDFMAQYLRREPGGCFAAQAGDGTVVGCVFCFVWGQVGWFGSLAVAPEWQGRGVGQTLTRRAVEHLEARGCRRIGLETWPQSPQMRHLYGKFGFRPCRSTLKLLRKASPRPAVPGWWATWAGAGDPAGLPAALDAVGHVGDTLHRACPSEPAADHRTEVRVAVEAGWAEVLVLRDPAEEPAAFALCYVKRPSGAPVGALDARLLAVAPAVPEPALDALLAECDRRALALGAHSVTCDVNLRHSHAAALLRERGFRPVYELVRMERPLTGFDPLGRSRLVDCARWAG